MSPRSKKRYFAWTGIVLALIAVAALLAYFGLAPKAASDYSISASLRFASTSSEYLNKTFTIPTNNKTWTFSAWVKRGAFSGSAIFGTAFDGSSNDSEIYWGSGNNLVVEEVVSGVTRYIATTNALFRDPAAWIHLVVKFDSTQSTASDRIKVYINGIQASFSSATYPTQNLSSVTNSAVAHYIGTDTQANRYYDGYLSDVYFIDGQALTPESFGQYDQYGYWRPKAVNITTANYGTNGFHLDFNTNTNLGKDASGKGNDWTSNNFNTYDQVIDTPTNSFATLSPIVGNVKGNISKANLQYAGSTAGTWMSNSASIAFNSGKFYWEGTVAQAGNTTGFMQGVGRTSANSSIYATYQGASPDGYGAQYSTGSGGLLYNNATPRTVSGPTSLVAGDVMQVAVDATNSSAVKVWVAKNNTWLEGDPAAGTSPSWTIDSQQAQIVPMFSSFDPTDVIVANFGQGGTTTVTYYAAAGGSFRYQPPTGFKALSTANLPAPAVANPKNYFAATTYTGQGTTTSVYNARKTIFLTSGTNWVVPSDWNNNSNSIEVIGGGGGGLSPVFSVNVGVGGGGGGYSKVSNLALTSGNTITYSVGSGGAVAISGGDTYFNGSTCTGSSVCAKGGTAGAVGTGGAGGAAASGVGTIKYSGGTGGTLVGGGGGAAGPNGNGANGGSSNTTGGSGGGGGGGGTAGSAGVSSTFGAGGNNFASTGGGATSGAAGTNGGGGAGRSAEGGDGGAGGAGIEWLQTSDNARAGSGGGGGASGVTTGSSGTTGGSGALYGGGGGSGQNGSAAGNGTSGAGAQGIIVISYTPQNIGFTPDLVWIKDRTSALAHQIFDSSRFLAPYWSSNSSAAESGGGGSALTAFLTNGFSLGSNGSFNTSGNNYISWLWKKAPTTDGVDIVTYTGDNTANRAIGHNLGKRPDFVIVKRRDAAGDGYVWHNGMSGAAYFTLLDSTAAQSNANSPWGTGAFTSSSFMVTNNATNNLNALGATYVAYLFASTTGYSDFGIYTGNGSADGPFVYTGFRPRYVMLKRIDSTSNWYVYDAARSSADIGDIRLYPQVSNAEDISYSLDLLSNGFKIRTSGADHNASAGQDLYAAFAEQPYQQSSQPYNLTIATSTRFASTSSEYLSKTFGSGNRQKWTFSTWTKRGGLGINYYVIFSDGSTSNTTLLYFDSNDKLNAAVGDGASAVYTITTSAAFRDPAAWLHIVWAVDTTQSVSTLRNRLYVNGVELNSFSPASYPTLNFNTGMNNSNTARIGDNTASTHFYYDGYLSDAYFVDGQQLDPTSFGEYDASGYWRPKSYTGTYGTNGFHVPLMGTSSTLSFGTDTSGNGNFFTPSNFQTYDAVKDSPTNSFPTFNPLNNAFTNPLALVAGNLVARQPAGGTTQFGLGPTLPATGKWYWETIPSFATIGGVSTGADSRAGSGGTGSFIGFIYNAGGSTNGLVGNPTFATYASGDVIGYEFDADAGTVKAYKNGTLQGTGAYAISGYNGGAPLLTERVNTNSTDTTAGGWTGVFGANGTTSLTYDSASGGYFRFTPSTGYKALSTANLPAPSITVPKNYFDAVTYNSPVLILHTDGANNSTTFTDNSTSAHAMTANGNAAISTAQSKFGGASGVFDGTGDYLSTPSGSDFNFGSGDFTIDTWMYLNALPPNGTANGSVLFSTDGGAAVFTELAITISTNATCVLGHICVWSSSSGTSWDVFNGTDFGSIGTITGGWHHFAFVRNGSTWTAYIDGTAVGSQTSSAALMSAGNIYIGGQFQSTSGTNGFNGYLDEYRISKGTAVWKSNFTPPTSAYSPNSITSANFQPDIAWLKDRSAANSHGIFDSSRSLYPAWASNASSIEGGTSAGLSSIITGGITLGASTTINTIADNFISWMWKKSATAGTDIVTYTGDNTANRAITHNLGKRPDFVIVKRRDAAGDGYVWHSSFSGATTFALLDSTAATSTTNSPWGTGAFTSSSFMVTNNATNNLNALGGTYVAYLFASTTGYSNFGIYTGNGSSDGSFIYTGFKPRMILSKGTASESWEIWDSARQPNNLADATVFPNLTNAEQTNSGNLDMLSNGFKMRSTTTGGNTSGNQYIYAAFAEQPFKYSAATVQATTANNFLLGFTF